jgi:ATP-dependent RNA helicase DeaD
MTDKAHHPSLPEAFEKLGVRNSVLRGLAEANFVEPSEIQALVIPPALAGKDILGQARTGTGKTAAFGVPLLCNAVYGFATQALILVPTRELAVQVVAEIERLGKHTPVRVCGVFGGERIAKQMKGLKHSPEILVGTPGRVMDLLERRVIDFANIRYAVLDEVDRMLDIGFRDDIREILGQMNRGRGRRTRVSEFQGEKMHPDNRDAAEGEDVPTLSDGPLQTIFVSATIAGEIERLARKYMRDGQVEKLIAQGSDESPTVATVEQYYLPCGEQDKGDLCVKLIQQENPDLAIVFTRTKRGAEKLTKRLHGANVDVREIHGNLNQSQRDKVMTGFRENKFKVLVATDLASRGIDVAGISHIINFDVPEDPEAYVHRIGRTARMGTEGKAVTFVTPEQGEELTRIEALINLEIPRGELPGNFEPTYRTFTRDTAVVDEAPRTSFVKKVEAQPAEENSEEGTGRRRRRTMAKVPRRGRR